jgi:hypothetical protein
MTHLRMCIVSKCYTLCQISGHHPDICLRVGVQEVSNWSVNDYIPIKIFCTLVLLLRTYTGLCIIGRYSCLFNHFFRDDTLAAVTVVQFVHRAAMFTVPFCDFPVFEREKNSRVNVQYVYVSYSLIRLVRACALSRTSAILVSPDVQETGPNIHVSSCKPKTFTDIRSDFD